MIDARERRLIANAPEGVDALYLASTLQAAGGMALHVARDDVRMARMVELFAFLQPETEVVTIPAWDCLPYDRVGPHRDILAQRIAGLVALLTPPAAAGGRLVVTTVNAILQRLPPRTALQDRAMSGRPGDRIGLDELAAFFTRNGYHRSETVIEAGEFALRGGIVDVFPPGAAAPLRLDFFGDDLESIRAFDPFTQRTTEQRAAFDLIPVNEIILDEASISRFRSRYREIFGAVSGDDPLYSAVSAGRWHPGMEHWLPLFHDGLETLFDYLPNCPVTLDHQADEVRAGRWETITDFHQARAELQGLRDTGGWPYRPLPPEALYLDETEWSARVAERKLGQFWPFAAPDSAGSVVDAQGRGRIDFAAARTAADGGHSFYGLVVARIGEEQAAGRRVLLTAHTEGSLDRLSHLLAENGVGTMERIEQWSALETLPAATLGLAVLGLEQGFGGAGFTLISEQDILGERLARPTAKRRRAEDFISESSSLSDSDLVVHVEHGIGRYEGLETLDVAGAPHDCLKLVYHGGDKLYLPVENIEVLSRYGSETPGVELDRLGQGQWQARRARVKARIKSIADELIKVAAARELRVGEAMVPAEGLYDEFCARFPYPETDDQLRAIEETLDDLASGKPMDRLICGDVGFGKTEVALRATFIAAMTGRQVAVVVPTTLLARQHHNTFRARFAGLPLRIAQLSRLVSAKDAARVRSELKSGQLDIVIGTHALLSKAVGFRDLGLLIVDEEQHFGVKQKERLKQLREDVHVMTLTATPIPRTLQLALSGVKEMSLIASPPVDRLAVRTFVLPYDPVMVREAILREYHRGGQIFYVCPRIEDLPELQERLEKLVPEVKLGVAHGRLAPSDLEAVMTAFVEKRFDLLLSTNIIESGLDIPSANTMVIHRSDMFGLSQLYQLRGRIGRSKLRGYAYMTLPPGRILTGAATRRLEVMQSLDTLGAGFSLASHDLDIRGAGNLLGEEQSGHIREIGIELYQQMLEEAVAAARSGGALAEAGAPDAWTPQISLGTPVLIPDSYVADLNLRLSLYRRVAGLVDRPEIDAFGAELIDRFGSLPPEVENLLQIVAIKQLCRDAAVERIEAGPKGALVTFRQDQVTNLDHLLRFVQRESPLVKLRPDQKLVYQARWDNAKERVAGVQALLGELAPAAS